MSKMPNPPNRDAEPVASTAMSDYFEALYAEAEREKAQQKKRKKKPEKKNHRRKPAPAEDDDDELEEEEDPTDLGVDADPPPPYAVQASSSSKPTPAVEIRCANPACRSPTTYRNYWANSALVDGKLCNPCARYEGKHNVLRPLALIQRAAKRAHPTRAVPARTAHRTQTQTQTQPAPSTSTLPVLPSPSLSPAPSASADEPDFPCSNCSNGTGPPFGRKWRESKLRTGDMLCYTCWTYERQNDCIRPSRLFKK
ncbi:hypothetical protein C8R46DRAFT_1058663, partial [Mycena filopes]